MSERRHHQGVLKKKAGSRGGFGLHIYDHWQDRHFVFTDEGLSYYKDVKAYQSKQPELGFLALDTGFSICEIPGKESSTQFQLKCSTRELGMCVQAKTMAEKKQWMSIFDEVKATLEREGTPVSQRGEVLRMHIGTIHESPAECLCDFGKGGFAKSYVALYPAKLKIWAIKDHPRKKAQVEVKIESTSLVAGWVRANTMLLSGPFTGEGKTGRIFVKCNSDEEIIEWLNHLGGVMSSPPSYPEGYTPPEEKKADNAPDPGNIQQQLEAAEKRLLEVLQVTDKSTARQRAIKDDFMEYCKERKNVENCAFYIAADEWRFMEGHYRFEGAQEIFWTYLSDDSEMQIGHIDTVRRISNAIDAAAKILDDFEGVVDEEDEDGEDADLPAATEKRASRKTSKRPMTSRRRPGKSPAARPGSARGKRGRGRPDPAPVPEEPEEKKAEKKATKKAEKKKETKSGKKTEDAAQDFGAERSVLDEATLKALKAALPDKMFDAAQRDCLEILRTGVLPSYTLQFDQKKAESTFFLNDNVSLDELLGAVLNPENKNSMFRSCFLLHSIEIFKAEGQQEPLRLLVEKALKLNKIPVHRRMNDVLLTWMDTHKEDFTPQMAEVVRKYLTDAFENLPGWFELGPNDEKDYHECTAEQKRITAKINEIHLPPGTTPNFFDDFGSPDDVGDVTFHRNHISTYQRTSIGGSRGKRQSVDLKSKQITPPALLRAPGISPKVMADHLTMWDLEELKQVDLRAFVGLGWMEKTGETCHLMKMIEIFNERCNWISFLILTASEADRPLVIKYWVEVMVVCLETCNYYSLHAISSGLTRSSVFRLKKLFWQLPPAMEEHFNNIRTITKGEKNSLKYRKIFEANLGRPQVPHLAVVCKDIFGLEDNSKVFKKGTRNVNFKHFWIEYDKLDKVVLQSQKRAPLYDLCEMNQTVMTALKFSQNGCTMSETDAFSMSYELHPPPKAVLRQFAKELAKKEEEERKANAVEEEPARQSTPGVLSSIVIEEDPAQTLVTPIVVSGTNSNVTVVTLSVGAPSVTPTLNLPG